MVAQGSEWSLILFTMLQLMLLEYFRKSYKKDNGHEDLQAAKVVLFISIENFYFFVFGWIFWGFK